MANGGTIKERLTALEVKMKLLITLMFLIIAQLPALILYLVKLAAKNLFAR